MEYYNIIITIIYLFILDYFARQNVKNITKFQTEEKEHLKTLEELKEISDHRFKAEKKFLSFFNEINKYLKIDTKDFTEKNKKDFKIENFYKLLTEGAINLRDTTELFKNKTADFELLEKNRKIGQNNYRKKIEKYRGTNLGLDIWVNSEEQVIKIADMFLFEEKKNFDLGNINESLNKKNRKIVKTISIKDKNIQAKDQKLLYYKRTAKTLLFNETIRAKRIEEFLKTLSNFNTKKNLQKKEK